MADAAARTAAMQQAITDLAGFMATFVTAQTGANNGFPATQEGYESHQLRKNTEATVQLSLSDKQYTQKELGWTSM